MRVVASNDKPDLEREQLDVAIRFVPRGADTPDGERLLDCEIFPVCSPALARDARVRCATPADLADHVRLDFETLRDGRPWSEWDVWFGAMKLPAITPASTLRFSHYDQVIPAAIEGSGVAMGCAAAPYPPPARRHPVRAVRPRVRSPDLGSFFIVLRPDVAASDATEAFVAWLRSEVRRDGELTLALPEGHEPVRVSEARSRVRRP